MNNHDKISSIILAHWQNYHPKMLAQFRQEGRLKAELEATAQQFSDLVYELTAVKKMDYRAAWEMAIAQFLLPEEEESSSTSRNRSPSLPATSE
jgi:hypothetical protein